MGPGGGVATPSEVGEWEESGEPRKTCTKCPERGPQPLKNFHRASAGKYGRRSICKECARRIASESWRKAHAPKAGKRGEKTSGDSGGKVSQRNLARGEQKGEASPARETAASPQLLTIDLSDYPEMVQEIKRQAKEEDRTPEAQVRYWLRGHLGYVAGARQV